VSDIWRFPVKSFAGERLRRAFVGPFGILGDRLQALVDETGTPMSARRAHGLLGFSAHSADLATGEGVSVTTPEGWELDWGDPAVVLEASRAAGRPLFMVRRAGGMQDAAPVHLVTTASLAATASWLEGEQADRRRFRANLVLELDPGEPFAETRWIGATLAFGEDGPLLRVVSPTERCAVTTFDPDTLERDNRVLAGLARERENLFGVYATVTRAGWVVVGAPFRVLASPGT
jgi:uncharacterized protein YcbX